MLGELQNVVGPLASTTASASATQPDPVVGRSGEPL